MKVPLGHHKWTGLVMSLCIMSLIRLALQDKKEIVSDI